MKILPLRFVLCIYNKRYRRELIALGLLIALIIVECLLENARVLLRATEAIPDTTNLDYYELYTDHQTLGRAHFVETKVPDDFHALRLALEPDWRDPRICRSTQLYMIISGCLAGQRRSVHRQNFGHRVGYLFVVPRCRTDEQNVEMSRESARYSDLLQLSDGVTVDQGLLMSRLLMVAMNVTLRKGLEFQGTLHPQRYLTVMTDDYSVEWKGVEGKLRRVHPQRYPNYSASYVHWRHRETAIYEVAFHPSDFLVVSWPLAQKMAVAMYYQSGYETRPWINLGIIMSRLNVLPQHWSEIYPASSSHSTGRKWINILSCHDNNGKTVLATNSRLFCLFHWGGYGELCNDIN